MLTVLLLQLFCMLEIVHNVTLEPKKMGVKNLLFFVGRTAEKGRQRITETPN